MESYQDHEWENEYQHHEDFSKIGPVARAVMLVSVMLLCGERRGHQLHMNVDKIGPVATTALMGLSPVMQGDCEEDFKENREENFEYLRVEGCDESGPVARAVRPDQELLMAPERCLGSHLGETRNFVFDEPPKDSKKQRPGTSGIGASASTFCMEEDATVEGIRRELAAHRLGHAGHVGRGVGACCRLGRAGALRARLWRGGLDRSGRSSDGSSGVRSPGLRGAWRGGCASTPTLGCIGQSSMEQGLRHCGGFLGWE